MNKIELKSKTVKNMKKVWSLLKSIDTFGIPVSLTFKGHPEIKSVIGGIFTVIASLVVGIYFFI